MAAAAALGPTELRKRLGRQGACLEAWLAGRASPSQGTLDRIKAEVAAGGVRLDHAAAAALVRDVAKRLGGGYGAVAEAVGVTLNCVKSWAQPSGRRTPPAAAQRRLQALLQGDDRYDERQERIAIYEQRAARNVGIFDEAAPDDVSIEQLALEAEQDPEGEESGPIQTAVTDPEARAEELRTYRRSLGARGAHVA